MSRRRNKREAQPLPGDPSDPAGLHALLLRYVEWLQVRNYSESTVRNRLVNVGYFMRWAEERGITRAPDVTRPVLERYQRSLFYYRKRTGDPLSVRSQNARLVPLRAFFKWLAKERLVLYNPAAELELPRLEKRLPRNVLTISEAETVLNGADATVPLGLRDRAILEVFYSTGMRRMEVIGLEIYDLDGERGTVLVRQGKGKKDRVIPIGARAAAWVDRYLYEVRPDLLLDPSERTLFVSVDGTPFTAAGMTQLVRRYVDRAELGKKGACHLFRHTMATLMLEGGADIRFIQAMLGHARLDTTQIYTQVSVRKLKEIHDATHPARLSRRPPSDADDAPDAEELLSALAAEAAAEDEG